MQLLKTEKARAELQGGTRTLGQRERALLILADGGNLGLGANCRGLKRGFTLDSNQQIGSRLMFGW